jgi:hypothetical protein
MRPPVFLLFNCTVPEKRKFPQADGFRCESRTRDWQKRLAKLGTVEAGKGSFDCGYASLREAKPSLRITIGWLFVAQGFGGEGSAGGPRWVQGCNEGNSDCYKRYQNAIHQAWGERDVVDGVDLR